LLPQCFWWRCLYTVECEFNAGVQAASHVNLDEASRAFPSVGDVDIAQNWQGNLLEAHLKTSFFFNQNGPKTNNILLPKQPEKSCS